MLCLNMYYYCSWKQAIGIKGSLLVGTHCNKTADCKDPNCFCADFQSCVCGKFSTKQFRLNDLKFDELNGGDLKN